MDDVDVVKALEVELLSPAARRCPGRLGQRLTGETPAPGLVLLTYVSDPTGRRARRSSLWRRRPDGWKLRHHQDTLC